MTRCKALRSLLRLTPPLLATASLLLATRAHAQPADPIALTWNAPDDCPSADEVRARILKLAGPLKANATPLSADATITRIDADNLHLRLVVRAGEQLGERNIDGKSCKALAGAAAVALVLLLHSDAPLDQSGVDGAPPADGSGTSSNTQASGTATPPAGKSDAPSPAQKAPEPPEATDTGPSPPRRFHVLLRVPALELSVGPLREPSVGLAAGAGISYDRWRLLLSGTAWRAQHRSANSTDLQYGAEIERLTATLLACRAVLLSRLEIGPCASLSFEHLSARGTGSYIASRTEQTNWLAPGLGGQARLFATQWLSFVLGIQLKLETARPSLFLQGIGPIEKMLPAAGTLTVGSEWIL